MPDDAGFHATDLAAAVTSSRTALEAEPEAAEVDAEFDEAAYLITYPDVAEAVKQGLLASGREHFQRAGKQERRLDRPEYRRHAVARPVTVEAPPAITLDALALSDSGALFVAGWTDDRHTALTAITGHLGEDRHWSWHRFPRLRRADVEAAVPAPHPYHYGFWLIGRAEPPVASTMRAGRDCRLAFEFANGTAAELRHAPMACSDVGLRDLAMGYLADCGYYGNHVAETFTALDKAAGDCLVDFNRSIARSITAAATVERFGPQRPRYRGSIIVPIHGIADYLFVQSCTYAAGRGIAEYKFIYVINSPELAEILHREARIAEMIYGLSTSLVLLPANAGFGSANNVGVRFARSDRVLCVNPDVFPRDPDWAQHHGDRLDSLPAEQTRLFGTSLYYDDGSLMHGGMYFEAESTILARDTGMSRRTVLRVEHYGKGAPAWARQFVASRPVPAVTGAFMSIDRGWFERLGGFTEDYVFGHYEDADLCLKSLQAGTPVWLHDIPMWHLEGKGSRRLPPHEGGSMLNRWLFTRRWEPMIVPDLLRRRPRPGLLDRGAIQVGSPATQRATPTRSAQPAASRCVTPAGTRRLRSAT